LALTEQHHFDLIITDYKMEPVNGLELIRGLRQREVSVPIILLTGFAEALGLQPNSTGADVVLQKSANEITTLVRHTKRLLGPPRKPMSQQRRPMVKRTTGGSS
jgi:CheY-like chemotaxis protein